MQLVREEIRRRKTSGSDRPSIQVLKPCDITMWQDDVVSKLICKVVAVIHLRLRWRNLLLKHLTTTTQ